MRLPLIATNSTVESIGSGGEHTASVDYFPATAPDCNASTGADKPRQVTISAETEEDHPLQILVRNGEDAPPQNVAIIETFDTNRNVLNSDTHASSHFDPRQVGPLP